ncbi:MAG: M20 family metallopeptidase [Saprospiraceae bacterium]|nr:M20 family metallopeptidase [Saprospiraceae bacterium]
MLAPADFHSLAEQFQADAVTIRRHLHAHPELSFEEHETAMFIAKTLKNWDIPHQTGVSGTGIVVLLKGKNPDSRTVALRADMDALPILEKNNVPYKSQNDGVMHACGHDVHTTCLLTALRILNASRDRWSGTVKALFQPGEEKLPGGASLMIAEGVLDNPRPEAILGQHVHPPLRAGVVGFREGMYMASTDEVYITVHGRGGHGALPNTTIDPVAISAQLITALQQLVSRQADPGTPSVLSFGKIYSDGGATNVIPNTVHLEGTFRTHDENWRNVALRHVQHMAESVCRGMGADCTVRIVSGYPALHNHETLTRKARTAAETYLGRENVVELPIRMTGEDFAYYSRQIPACFYRLGTGNPERGVTSPVHSDTFDIDEAALITGGGLMAWLAVMTE